jgi:predicted lipoprotein with Yx(FWY)xxD motif
MLGTGLGSGTSAVRTGRGAIALIAIAGVLAACAAPGAATNPPATAGPTTAATTVPATNPPATGAGPVTLTLRTDAMVGPVVTGKDGMSLYVFEKDKGDGTSACYGQCAGTWPPLTVASAADVIPGSGVTGGLGTITRTDGTIQVTLGGAPLYYFAGDSAAGDTKGQGLNDVWYLASPTGTSADGESPAASPASSKCTGPACY